ncbi:MAG TPA: RNA polymerase subunit sigma-70 [Rhizobacter sp.]|nr:RNA polymerase subunit sigma-70 [Rhizobacter sp.]
MPAASDTPETELLARARAGDTVAFERLVKPQRRRLQVHCYRMLGSPHDADDAVQETLLAAWRGIASFEGRSTLHTWLYQISTRVCLRLISQRPQRLSSPNFGPALTSTADLGEWVGGPVWIEPLPDVEWLADALQKEPANALQRRQSVALAFIAALQHLPGTQRAVLLLRDVLEYSAAEAAEMLGTTTASVNSALQRAQQSVKNRMPGTSQAVELHALAPASLDKLLRDLVDAWESRDVAGLVSLLAEDARFTMPPLPAWFDGRASVAKFIAERMFATPWRLAPLWANGQPGFACYMKHPGTDAFRLGAVNLLALRAGRIVGIHAFLDPAVHGRFGLPTEIS